MSAIGPFSAEGGRLVHCGNGLSPSIQDVVGTRPFLSPNFVEDLARDERGQLAAMARLSAAASRAAADIAAAEGAVKIDLPLITRMISSPGALANTICSDVDPFKVDFFGNVSFLSQSSQLYLELALLLPGVTATYCLDKSYRQERADYRHLPEFNHFEYESRGTLESVIEHQAAFVRSLADILISSAQRELEVFGTCNRVERLARSLERPALEIMTFADAMNVLHRATGDEKFRRPTERVQALDGYAEVLLTQLVGDRTVIVTNYPEDEVAFYHAAAGNGEARNADLLIAGYGELLGSGERHATADDIVARAQRAKLPLNDYQPYLQSRRVDRPGAHVGWGMGVERLLQILVCEPFIWRCRLFPRLGFGTEI